MLLKHAVKFTVLYYHESINQSSYHEITRSTEGGSERGMIWLNGGMITTATAASNHRYHTHHTHHHQLDRSLS